MSKKNTKYIKLMEKKELNNISALTTSDRTPIYYPQSIRDENYSSFNIYYPDGEILHESIFEGQD